MRTPRSVSYGFAAFTGGKLTTVTYGGKITAMSVLDDLASTLQTLAENIRNVDAESGVSAADDAAEQATAFGSNELTTALASVKHAVEQIRDQLGQTAEAAENVANEVRGMAT